MSDIVTMEIKGSTKEVNPKFDHNFLVSVQTSQEVPAVEISRLLSAVEEHGIAAMITYVGTIDYDVID